MSRQINLEERLKSLDKSCKLMFVKMNKGSTKVAEIYQRAKAIFKNVTVKLADENEVLNINKAALKSGKYNFVFEKFDLQNPAQAYAGSATIYGLSIIIMALEQKVMIREIHSVYFGTAFKDMVVCASNITTSQKGEIASLVKAMNGQFETDITDQTTHLITNNTMTAKYIEAAKRNIPIYHIDWINQVYKTTTALGTSLGTIKADHGRFDHYVLPPFFDLKITTTGLAANEREKVKNEVEEHGGTFEDVFRKDNIHVLIVGGDVINDKYRVAKSSKKIHCLRVNWIYDSIEAHHALPFDNYVATPGAMSKSDKEKYRAPAEPEAPEKNEIDDDLNTLSTQKTHESLLDREMEAIEKPMDLSARLIEMFKNSLTVEKAKKTGPIFDGMHFNVFDFSYGDAKKLKKILNSCGGWCTDLDENVTHILCLDINSALSLNELTKTILENGWHPILINFEYVSECLDKGKLLPLTQQFIIRDFATKPALASSLLTEENLTNAAGNQENTGKVKSSKLFSSSKPLETSNENKSKKQAPSSAQKRKFPQSKVPPKKVKRAKFPSETIWDQLKKKSDDES